MRACTLFVCLCLFTTVYGSGNSLKDETKCGAPTCNPSDKFKYIEDVIYQYEYKVNVETYFSGTSNNRSSTEITATAKIEFSSPCEGLVQIIDVSVKDQDGLDTMRRLYKIRVELSRNVLRFGFHNGIITEICPDETDDDWVLNFKRALLSLFQNSMERFDMDFKGVEQDIHGNCQVDYKVRGQENTSLILVKTRDLSQCTNRHKYRSILQTVRYNFQSKYQTWPVLKSESKCVITVDNSVYKAVSCRERHLFEPFSGKDSGAMTTVTQDLTLVNEYNKTGSDFLRTQDQVWSAITKRSSLLHDHIPYGESYKSAIRAAKDVLVKLCNRKSNSPTNGADGDYLDNGATVGAWGQLVHSLRKLRYNALVTFEDNTNFLCEEAVEYFWKAIPYTASVGSVEFITDKIINNKVDQDTREEWLTSTTMIPRPEKEMLVSMLKLVKAQSNDKLVSFAVSTLLHSYCKHNKKTLRECCEEETPKNIVAEFENIVKEQARKDLANGPKTDRTNIIIAIKALGNIGGFNQEFSDILISIIGDDLMPMPIRLTAIDAFRKTPCAETREYFLETFREDYVNIEIRLASYLQVMRCPDLSTIRKIFYAFKHESVNQVATFVWSHLTNLGKSSLPSRVEIQGLLSGNTVPQLEDIPDFRLFSRNYEQSVFFDQFNTGGNYEANVIFSPDSYIPRSLGLNLTVDMFGESINILELKARAEGFEKYFEQMLRSFAPLKKPTMEDVMDNLRSIRSLNNADSVRKKVDDHNYQNEALKHQFPMAELGIKVFGNEISYWNGEGDEEIMMSLARLNPEQRFREILSGKEVSYNKTSLFLDTTFTVPTGAGLQLSMNLLGTSNIDCRVKMSSNIQPKSHKLDFEGTINPSVALNVAATMVATAGGLTSTAIRLNTRLYTATAVEARLNVSGLDLIRLELSLPQKRQEIFAAKSELLTLYGDLEWPQQGLNQNRIKQNTCSWPDFDAVIGIKICAAYELPNMANVRDAPYFIMSGPAEYVISLEKTDPTATNFLLQFKWDTNKTGNFLSVSYDTPKSKEKHMIKAELNLPNTTDISAGIAFHSDKNTVIAKGLYRNLEHDKRINMVIINNGRKDFETQVSLQTRNITNGAAWDLDANLVLNNKAVAGMSGTLLLRSKANKTQYDISVEFQATKFASNLTGYYTPKSKTEGGGALLLDYEFYNTTKQSIYFAFDHIKNDKNFRDDFAGNVCMQFTAYPMYNFYATLKKLQIQGHYTVDFNVSASQEDASNPSLSFSLNHIEKLSGVSLDTSLLIVKPFPFKMKYHYAQIGSKYTLHALLNMNPNSGNTEVSGYLFRPPGTHLYLYSELNVTIPKKYPCRLKLKVYESQTREYQVNFGGLWFDGLRFNFDVMYQDLSKSNSISSHKLKALLATNRFKDILISGRFSQDNRQTTFGGQCEYNNTVYNTLIRYVLFGQDNFTTFAEMKINDHDYNMQLFADLNNNTKVTMEIHMDRNRDILLSYQLLKSPQQKRLITEFNWNVNRNPNEKVSIDLLLENKGTWNRTGYITLYYPNRVINGDFDFVVKDWYFDWRVHLAWSNDQNIKWHFKAYSEAKEETVYALLTHMNTPFTDWNDTSCNIMWRYRNNLQSLNGSVHWQKKKLEFGFLFDYLFKGNEFYGIIDATVNSSVPGLLNAAALAKHRVVWKKSVDTILSFRHKTDDLLFINSSWTLNSGQKEDNITGSVAFVTPFKEYDYNRCALRTHFVLGHKRDINGITFFDSDKTRYKITVNGHMYRLTNCMLMVNSTNLVTRESVLTSRFGYVEADRHFVAMVVTPSNTTGIEILLQMQSFQDFNVFGHVALASQSFVRAMITAKRAPDEMDFRVGWNKMDLGFTGIWHWHSLSNFLYLYKLYTPLEGFEENGLVLKNIYGPGLDTELSVRLSKHKFGIAIMLLDDGKGLLEVIHDKLEKKQSISDTLVENFDTTAQVTIDTLYYPTINFHAHIWKNIGANQEDIFEVYATLNLPNKQPVVLTDVFILEELSVMRNTLHLQTPFESLKELKSTYTVDIVIGEKVNVTCLVFVNNGTNWNEFSYKVYYDELSEEDDAYIMYLASLEVVTPLAVLPSLESKVTVRLEGVLRKMYAEIKMPSFVIKAQGQLELENVTVATAGHINLTSEYLENYFIEINFNKDFSNSERHVTGEVRVQQLDQVNYLSTQAEWDDKYISIQASGALAPVLLPTNLTLVYDERELETTLLTVVSSTDILYFLNVKKMDKSLNVEARSPHQGFRMLKLYSQYENNIVSGSLSKDTTYYNITGNVVSEKPLQMSLQLIPNGQGDNTNIRIKVDRVDNTSSLTAQFTNAVMATLHATVQWDPNLKEISAKLDLPRFENKVVYFKSRLDINGLQHVVHVQAVTPFQKLKSFTGNTDFVFGPETGYLLCKYDLPDMKGNGDLKWSFLSEDMYIKAIGHQNGKKIQNSVDLDVHYGISPSPVGFNKTNAGFKMDLDHVWLIGANTSFGLIFPERGSLLANVILPKPNVDVHTLQIEFDKDMGKTKDKLTVLDVEYKTDVTKIITGVKGKMKYLDDIFEGNASVLWTSNSEYSFVDNVLVYRWDKMGSRYVNYVLTSPLYKNKATFTLQGSYQKDLVEHLKLIRGNMFKPGHNQIGELNIRYGGTRHTDGHFNVSTPFENLPWLRSVFYIKNLEEQSDNKVKLFWPNHTSSFNMSHVYKKLNNGFKQSGKMSVIIPLKANHLVNTQYYFIQEDKTSNGNASIHFDQESVLNGSFNQILSKSERNLDLVTSDIKVESNYAPIGIKYIHEHDNTGNTDIKQATVFHLHNTTKLNVTGKLEVFTNDIGKKLRLTGIHGNRTLAFDSHYEYLEKNLSHASKIKWEEDVWIGYNINFFNMTTLETESHRIVVNLSYPLRTLDLEALFHLQDTVLDGSARLDWDVFSEGKFAELKGRWENPPTKEGNIHNVDLSLSHPTFRKDVTLSGHYQSKPTVISNITLELQYSDYDIENLKFRSLLTDQSVGSNRDYKFALNCEHPSTNLDVDIKSDISIRNNWYYLNDYYKLKKSLISEKMKHNKLIIDLNQNKIKWERENLTYSCKVNGTWDFTYPQYSILSSVHRPNSNDTGVVTLSLKDKKLVAHYNSTDDISYHLIGLIADTRSARLDAWRNFAEVTTVDLASYVRLNHSRLLTGSFIWRPNIFEEVTSETQYLIKELSKQVNETVSIFVEAPREAHSALKNLWSDLEPKIRDLLDDLGQLHVIKEDLENFKIFLNDFYDNNEFYIKNIVEFTNGVLVDMDIKDHFKSLPGLVSDVWGVMGNTSMTIKQSLSVATDSIKNSFANFATAINKFLETDYTLLITKQIEEWINKYDEYVASLHKNFIKHWTEVWNDLTTELSKYWETLKVDLEPIFFSIFHQVESLVSTVWQSLVDFFNNRSQEIIDLPYFDYVSAFLYQIESIHKDLTHNDLMTNVKKYSKALWTMVWGKIESYIPDEIRALDKEMKNTFNLTMNSKPIHFVREKAKEAYIRLKWWYDYFLIGEALDAVGEILYNKTIDLFNPQTALQYDETHRTPKTNFIFDPNKGQILLEQKLPMSWHAFNRTPDFTEIPEYKTVKGFVDWLTANTSMWSYYSAVRPYLDIYNNLIPPFDGLAIMTGQGTLVTFDKRVFTVSEPGTFLLTKDYKHNNFTVLMESNQEGRYNLVILTKKQLIHIDLYREQVSIGNSMPLTLPASVEKFVLDRQTDVLTITSPHGLLINCNLLFRTCKLQISGWYYANLGGLLGTYNNEQYDDFQLPNKTLTTSISTLSHGWNIEPSSKLAALENHEGKNDTHCEKFFRSKVSPLYSCFSVIDAEPFYLECLSGVEACTLANSYLELCSKIYTPTRIPDHCVQCTTPEGEVIEEGSFYTLKYIPRSTDVVFVIEAQYCNKNLRKNKNMDLFMEEFDSKLQSSGFSDNRYAVVGYGGSGVYKKPRSLYVNNEVFTNEIEILQHFENLYIEKADLVRSNQSSISDAYSALNYATLLPFRAGVPRTLVLMPCGTSYCDDMFMKQGGAQVTSWWTRGKNWVFKNLLHLKLDYSSIYHSLMENSVTLHILMDGEFSSLKNSTAKQLFGIDNDLAYTNKDYQKLVGNTAIRKQVKLSKEDLKECTSLALETNGTIFAGQKLKGNRSVARRFSTVMGACIAQTAHPCAHAPRCECREARLHCEPCPDTQGLFERSFSEDFIESIDRALDTKILPSLR